MQSKGYLEEKEMEVFNLHSLNLGWEGSVTVAGGCFKLPNFMLNIISQPWNNNEDQLVLTEQNKSDGALNH